MWSCLIVCSTICTSNGLEFTGLADRLLDVSLFCDYPLSWRKRKNCNLSFFRKIALQKLPGNRNLWLCQLDDPGLSQYEHLLEAKVLLMSIDSWLLDNDDLEEEDILVYDFKDLSIKMLVKFNIFIARKVFKYQQVPKSILLFIPVLTHRYLFISLDQSNRSVCPRTCLPPPWSPLHWWQYGFF